MEKTSKELKAIMSAIDKYVKKHGGEVCVHAAFAAFDKKSNVVDDRIFALGDKKCVLISMEEMQKQIKKEKGEIVNW